MKHKFSVSLTLALVLAMLVTSLALADNLVPDGDAATPIGANPLNLGTVCVNSTTTGNVLLGITRQGNYANSNVFKVGTTATVTVLSSSSDLSAVMGSPNTINIPSDWDTVSNGTVAGTVSSSVTLTTGNTTGPFTGTVEYQASGTKSDDFSLDRNGT